MSSVPLTNEAAKDLELFHPKIAKEQYTITQEKHFDEETGMIIMSPPTIIPVEIPNPKWGKKLPSKSGWHIGYASQDIVFKHKSYSPQRTINKDAMFPIYIHIWKMSGEQKIAIHMRHTIPTSSNPQALEGVEDVVLPLWHKEPWKDILISQQPLPSFLAPPVEGELLAVDSHAEISKLTDEITLLKKELNSLTSLKSVDVSSIIQELQTKITDKTQLILQLKHETKTITNTSKPKEKTKQKKKSKLIDDKNTNPMEDILL